MSLVAERHKDVRTIVKVVSEKRNKGKKGIYSKMKLVKWRTFVKEKRKTHDCGYIYIYSFILIPCIPFCIRVTTCKI